MPHDKEAEPYYIERIEPPSAEAWSLYLDERFTGVVPVETITVAEFRRLYPSAQERDK